jgi:hypothetical protein
VNARSREISDSLGRKISAQEVWVCPLCPQKRTFCGALAMSAKCQKRTFRAEVPLTHFKSLTGIQPFADRLCCWPGAPFQHHRPRLCPRRRWLRDQKRSRLSYVVGACVMQQSHIHDPPKPIDLPPCPKCGNRMWLARIEPTDKPDYDQRTFECPRCDHSETMMIKFKK